MKYMWIIPLLFMILSCAPKRFNWNNSCSLYKECPEGKWCFIDIGPDGEPFEYGQCIKDED